MTPLAMYEVSELVEKNEEKEEIKKFIKKFSKIKPDDGKKLNEELEGLKILKLKKQDILKIIDFLPEDASDLNKVLIETSLNEDETNKILGAVKKYR